MSFEVEIKTLGIPCIARGSVTESDRSVGIMSEGLEDVTLHNVKNESRLNWLESKLDKLDKWQDTYDAIWEALSKQREEYERSRYDY